MSVEIMSGAKPSAQHRSATGQEKEPRPKPTVSSRFEALNQQRAKQMCGWSKQLPLSVAWGEDAEGAAGLTVEEHAFLLGLPHRRDNAAVRQLHDRALVRVETVWAGRGTAHDMSMM